MIILYNLAHTRTEMLWMEACLSITQQLALSRLAQSPPPHTPLSPSAHTLCASRSYLAILLPVSLILAVAHVIGVDPFGVVVEQRAGNSVPRVFHMIR